MNRTGNLTRQIPGTDRHAGLCVKRRMLGNQRGMAAIILSGLLFPFLVMMGFSALRLSQIADLRWLQQNCRKVLWSAQTQAASSIQQLMALNLVVRKLKIEKIQAESQLIAATVSYNIPGIAAAERWLASIHARQIATRAEQQALIRFGEAGLAWARIAVHASTKTWVIGSRMLYELELKSESANAAHMAVRPTVAEEFPEYETEDPFEEKQALQFKWLFDFKGRYSGVKKWFPTDLSIPESCGVTVTEKNLIYEPKLHQDKFFWSR